MKIRYLAAVTLIALAPTAQAQDAQKTQAMVTAWQDWATARAIPATAIAVGYRGQIIASAGQGRSPSEPYALASLSKAITATCLLQVLHENDITVDQTLGDIAQHFAREGITIPPDVSEIPLTALFTMSSGLSPDTTQGTFLFHRNKGTPNNSRFARYAVAPNARTGIFGDYYYNNGNYALLGSLLDALTQTDNVTACRDRVFPPQNRSSVGFNPEWVRFAAFGGWEASAEDYLGFVMQNFGADTQIAKTPTAFPHLPLTHKISYGLGTFFSHKRGRSTFWHTGAICNFGFADNGSYFAQYANGYAVVVNYDICGATKNWRPLDEALYDAAHQNE